MRVWQWTSILNWPFSHFNTSQQQNHWCRWYNKWWLVSGSVISHTDILGRWNRPPIMLSVTLVFLNHDKAKCLGWKLKQFGPTWIQKCIAAKLLFHSVKTPALLPLISVKCSFLQWSENRNAASTVLIIRIIAGKYVNGGNIPSYV